jgi:hypothetical protein
LSCHSFTLSCHKNSGSLAKAEKLFSFHYKIHFQTL